MDAHAVRRRAGGAGHRQGALPGPGGRVRGRDRPLRGAGRARADLRGLRAAAAADRRLDRTRPGRARRPRRAPGGQSHLRLVGGRPGGHRRGLRRRRRGGGRRLHLSPVTPGTAGNLRRGRQLRQDRRPPDCLGHQPGPARPPDHVRRADRHTGAQDPDRVARPGRRLRGQGTRVPGVRLRRRRVDGDRPPGEVDGGPVREPDVHHLCPRLPYARGDRRYGGRNHSRAAGQGAGRPRRVQRGRPAVQVPGRLLPHLHRFLPDPGGLLRGHRRLHQQGTRRGRLLLLVPHHRGRLPGRTTHRHAGPHARARPGRAPDAQPAAPRAVPVQHSDWLDLRLGRLPPGPAARPGHG